MEKTNDSNVNFVPFSEKILRMTINFYEDIADNPAVIENGTLQTIIQVNFDLNLQLISIVVHF